MSKKLLTAFVSAVIDNSTFEEMDTIYLSNRVMALVGEAVAEQETEAEQLIDLKDDLVALAVKNGKIGDTLAEQDILGAELMNLITPAPSQLNRDFWTTYASNPEQAVADFYQLSQKNDYIKVKAIWKSPSISLSQKRIPRKLRQLKRLRIVIIQPASSVWKMKVTKGAWTTQPVPTIALFDLTWLDRSGASSIPPMPTLMSIASFSTASTFPWLSVG